MSDQKQYYLNVKDGKIEEEVGSFFIAAPFEITVNNVTYKISFERHLIHSVVYTVSENDECVMQLHHPDYSPEKEPKEWNDPALSQFFVAMSHLKIMTSPAYRAHYEDNLERSSFMVSQTKLTSSF